MLKNFVEQMRVKSDSMGSSSASETIFLFDYGTAGLELELCRENTPIAVSVSGELNKRDISRNVKALVEFLIESPNLLIQLLSCYPASYAEMQKYFDVASKFSR